MRQNLLQLVQAFARRTGVPVPGAVVGVNQAEVRQMVALLEEVGEELVSRFNWESLKRKATWTSVAASSQGSVYALAGESLERILPGTFYNENEREPFVGPIPLHEWQAYSSGLTPAPDNIFTVVGDEILLWPAPPAGETMSFYWQSAHWILDADGTTTKASFTSDEDSPLFDATLMRLGLRWKWKMEKGLPYAEDMRAFEAAAMDKSSRGMLKPTLSMAGGAVGPRPAVLVPLNSTIPNA